MDSALVADAERLIADARTATGPPPGFPQFSDVPLGRYTNPSFFAAELEGVFTRSWLFAGHESEWPDRGSSRVIDLPGRSIALVRTGDGAIAAAPGDRAGSARVEQWGGFVFLNLGPAPVGLPDHIGALARRYSDLTGAPLRLAHRTSYDLAANWKIAAEAFLETYHIRTVHQQTAAPITETAATVNQLFPHGHSTSYVPWDASVRDAGADSFIWSAMFPPDVGTIEGAPEFYRRNTTVFSVFPNTVCPVDDHGVIVLTFWPVAVDRTRFELGWYGTDWGEGARPPGWDLRVAGWDAIMEEDLVNIEPIQRSVASAAHGGVPLSVGEARLYHLHEELDRRIPAGVVPDALRVRAVLDGQVVA